MKRAPSALRTNAGLPIGHSFGVTSHAAPAELVGIKVYGDDKDGLDTGDIVGPGSVLAGRAPGAVR